MERSSVQAPRSRLDGLFIFFLDTLSRFMQNREHIPHRTGPQVKMHINTFDALKEMTENSALT